MERGGRMVVERKSRVTKFKARLKGAEMHEIRRMRLKERETTEQVGIVNLESG